MTDNDEAIKELYGIDKYSWPRFDRFKPGTICPECGNKAYAASVESDVRVCLTCAQEWWPDVVYPWLIEQVLVEDDCAPDAYEYFEKKFIHLVGVKVHEFKKHKDTVFTLSDDELCMTWRHASWILQYSGDDPGHYLMRRNHDTRPIFIGHGI